MKKIRIGIIGIGFGQQVHFPVFQENENCEVTAICASDLSRARNIADRLNVPKAYGDWNELIADNEIDAISIATPPNLQSEIALKAISLGKNIFSEKPLALNLEAANKMALNASKTNIAHMIDFEFPEITEWQKTKSLLEENIIGKLQNVNVSWNTQTYSNKMKLYSWKTSTKNGGGTLNGFTSHVFHYLEWFVAPIKAISAKLEKDKQDNRDTDTLNSIDLEFDAGVKANLLINTDCPTQFNHTIEFTGDKATLLLENTTSDYVEGFKVTLIKKENEKVDKINIASSQETCLNDSRILPVARIVNRFVTWINTGTPQKPNFEDGLRVQKLIEAAKQSSETGTVITV